MPLLGDVTDAALFGGEERLEEVRLNPAEKYPDARSFAASVAVSVDRGEGFRFGLNPFTTALYRK